jgi:uncharacterized protein DUF4384
MDNIYFQNIMQKWLKSELKSVPQLIPVPEMYELLQRNVQSRTAIFSRTRWYFAAAAMLLMVFLTVTNFEKIFYPAPPPMASMEIREDTEEKEKISFDRSFKMHAKMEAPQAGLGERVSDKLIFNFQRKKSFYATEVDLNQQLDYPIGLNTQDNYRISVEFTAESYLYVFQLNSENILIQLFPDESVGSSNPLTASQKYIIPGAEQWYHLDQQKGVEKIYLTILSDDSDELPEIYKKYYSTRSASRKEKRLTELLKKLELLESKVLILENQ